MTSSDNHMRALSQEIPQSSIPKFHLKIILLLKQFKFQWNLPRTNGLKASYIYIYIWVTFVNFISLFLVNGGRYMTWFNMFNPTRNNWINWYRCERLCKIGINNAYQFPEDTRICAKSTSQIIKIKNYILHYLVMITGNKTRQIDKTSVYHITHCGLVMPCGVEDPGQHWIW